MVKTPAIRDTSTNIIYIGHSYSKISKKYKEDFGKTLNGEKGFINHEWIFLNPSAAAIEARECGQLKKEKTILTTQDIQ